MASPFSAEGLRIPVAATTPRSTGGRCAKLVQVRNPRRRAVRPWLKRSWAPMLTPGDLERTTRMSERRRGIIMNGVTGRMGTIQHLVRSVLAIRASGGLRLQNGDRVMPDPILVGRNAEKLGALAKAHGIERVTTDLDRALASRDDT